MISKVVQSNGSVIYLYDLYHTYEIHFHQQAYSIFFFFLHFCTDPRDQYFLCTRLYTCTHWNCMYSSFRIATIISSQNTVCMVCDIGHFVFQISIQIQVDTIRHIDLYLSFLLFSTFDYGNPKPL